MADFREYSAAFHAQNDDLMHYGVKGMKWKHHKVRMGGVVGLVDSFMKVRRRKEKKEENKEEKPAMRGTYAENHPRQTYDEAHPHAPRGTYAEAHPRQNYSETHPQNSRGTYAEAQKEKKNKFEAAAKAGVSRDEHRRSLAEAHKAFVNDLDRKYEGKKEMSRKKFNAKIKKAKKKVQSTKADRESRRIHDEDYRRRRH